MFEPRPPPALLCGGGAREEAPAPCRPLTIYCQGHLLHGAAAQDLQTHGKPDSRPVALGLAN